jgi:CelD/BcsL family acetyltransferase involved in cellulose biosynthesis
MDMGFKVSTLTTIEELRNLEEEWLALLGRAEADLPFLWPDWVITWWELFRQERSVIRDSLQVKVVRRDSGELMGVVPLMATERPAVGPVRVRTLGFIGADKYVTEQRAPIVDRACESEVGDALAAHLTTAGEWDWITWEGLKPESELAKTLGRAMDLRWGGSQAGNILHLPPSWQEFKRGFRTHLKKSVRHCYNSLRREGLTAQFDVATTPEQIAPALEIFLRLHTTLAQQADTRFDHFADPVARRFLVLTCSRLANRNITRVLTLRIGGVPVASRVAFQLPHCLYLYYSGSDPAWRKYAVATTLVAEAIRYAIDSGIPRLHLSMGKDASKSRWDPEMPLFHRAFWVRPQLSSRVALGVYSWARDGSSLANWMKSVLGRRFDGARTHRPAERGEESPGAPVRLSGAPRR